MIEHFGYIAPYGRGALQEALRIRKTNRQNFNWINRIALP